MYRDRDHDRHQHTLFWLAVTVISFTVFIMCMKNLWNRYLRYKENRRAKSRARLKAMAQAIKFLDANSLTG